MNEREKEALSIIIKEYPGMSEFSKGYILGVAESRASKKASANEKEAERAQWNGCTDGGKDVGSRPVV